MASELYRVTCQECKTRFYLEDAQDGECVNSGKPVQYEAVKTPSKPAKKTTARRVGQTVDTENQAVAMKFTAVTK